MPPRALFVTGTDTGIGKSTVACAIAAALAAAGTRVGVVKPFETGCREGPDGNLVPADALRLRYFSGCREPLDVICPYRARAPLAPSVALAAEGREIDLEGLHRTICGIVGRHQVTLIEGAGGLLVPVRGSLTFADLARDREWPVLVVVGNRLGALNHAQLTLRWARENGLRVAGYVVNTLSPEADVAAETNARTLAELLGPALGILPWLGPVARTEADRARLARAGRDRIDLSVLGWTRRAPTI